MNLDALIDTRNGLRTALNCHSGGARAVFETHTQWTVTLWDDEKTGAPSGNLAITRFDAERRREVYDATVTAEQADAIVAALAERGVCGGDAVEDVVHGVVASAQERAA